MSDADITIPRMPQGGEQYADQPVQFVDEVGGLYFRAICVANAWDAVPQHSHEHDHVTLIASGAAHVWIDGVYAGHFKAFHALQIEAYKKHIFQATEPNTRLVCVHNLHGKPYAIHEETKVGGA